MSPSISPRRGGFKYRLQRQVEDWLVERRDNEPTVVYCAVDGCDWAHHGPFAEARDAFASHRAAAHPEHRPRTRRQVLRDHEQARQVYARRQDAERA